MRENVNKKLVTNLELFGLFLTVLIVLVLLYPRDRLMNYAKPENYNILAKENIFLSIKYLEELIKNYPNYPDLKLLLAKKYIQIGEIKKANILLKDYINLKGNDPAVILLKFELLKYDAFSYKEGSQERKESLMILRQYLRENIQYINDPIYLKYLFNEAVALDDPISAREIAYKLSISKDKDRVYYLEKLVDLSIGTGDYEKALKALKKLYIIQPERSKYWLKKLAEIELHLGRYLDAVKRYELLFRIEKDYKKRSEYIKKTADILLWHKKYRKAAYVYIKGMEISPDFESKKRYFIKALKTLESGNHLSDAVKLIRRYGFDFVKDKETAKLMIKIALASNEPELARKLSIEVLEEIK